MIQGRIICKFKRKISLQIRRKRSCDFPARLNRSPDAATTNGKVTNSGEQVVPHLNLLCRF